MLIMGKVKVGIFFSISWSYFDKSFTEMFLLHMNFVQNLILIGCCGNRNIKFAKNIQKSSSQKP